ncbi:MAG TPA: hypothetical protein DIV86_05315 [Alphaproteobacteria bacterium]|nr:hypothetical protein [Alphaproteobacteria bacterium]
MQIIQKILVVDDELSNLEVISEYLEEESFAADKAINGKDALDMLNNPNNDYSAIVLDRMMPVMDGMELLRKIKEDKKLRDIPVVMQSAAAQPEQVREGIEAGVFYYITKPFEKAVFLAILRSALEYSFKRVRIKNDLRNYSEGMPMMDMGSFTFSKLDDLRNVCTVVSNAFAAPERAFFGINELVLNALEHGNLQISYEEKKQLLLSKKWESEIRRREALEENKDKFINLKFFNKKDHYEIVIKDSGKGFNPEKYLDFDELRAVDPNGRGIAMSRKYSFDEMFFEENGTKVTARITKKDE